MYVSEIYASGFRCFGPAAYAWRRDTVRAAYNYAEYLPLRRKMIQAWADYLDGLRADAEEPPLHRWSI